MRSHRVVGSLFVLLGTGLLALGALASSSVSPPGIGWFPLPPEVAVPFVFLQLATWAFLLGLFFLRPRRARSRPSRRRAA